MYTNCIPNTLNFVHIGINYLHNLNNLPTGVDKIILTSTYIKKINTLPNFLTHLLIKGCCGIDSPHVKKLLKICKKPRHLRKVDIGDSRPITKYYNR